MYKSKWIKIFLGGILLPAGFFGGWISKNMYDASNVIALEPLREQHSDFTFIDPLLTCRTEKKEFPEFQSLERYLINEVNAKKLAGEAEKISIYFRELTTGRWVGIDEDEKYAPASLLKVPIMISYYKLAEANPNVLEERLVFSSSEDWNDKQLSFSQQRMEVGSSYSIDELIQLMIVDSDNNAAITLFNNLNPEVFREVGRDLGIPIPEVDITPESMSVRTYSLFFRVLYNSSYFSRALSERALRMMSEPYFTGGIRKGVPPDIKVASKFGERAIRSGNAISAYQFHDCGIVYQPSHPYLLCVMTQGENFETLQTLVTDISRITNEKVREMD